MGRAGPIAAPGAARRETPACARPLPSRARCRPAVRSGRRCGPRSLRLRRGGTGRPRCGERATQPWRSRSNENRGAASAGPGRTAAAARPLRGLGTSP